MHCEREEREHGCEDGDENRTKTEDSCVNECIFEIITCNVALFNVIKENDRMAHDDSYQTGNAEKCHKAEGFTHDPQRQKCSDHSVGGSSQDKQRFDCILELKDKRKKYSECRDSHDYR